MDRLTSLDIAVYAHPSTQWIVALYSRGICPGLAGVGSFADVDGVQKTFDASDNPLVAVEVWGQDHTGWVLIAEKGFN